jgi:propanediol utilization protein
VLERVRQRLSVAASRLVPVAISARHVHLTREVLEATYGRGHELTKFRDLSQPGQFSAKETLTIIGARMHSIEGVRILGPVREYTQAELARTDGVALGLELPVRDSGKLAGSAPIVLVGPRGAVSLREGGIRAVRHIHASDADADRLRLKDGQSVAVRVPGEKGVVFENVIVRVSPSHILEMHLDTDDANAADVHCDMLVEIL